MVTIWVYAFPIYELYPFGLALYLASVLGIGVLHYRLSTLAIPAHTIKC